MLAQSTAPEETRFLELKPFSDEMIVSMGPQHPSTHGVLKLELRLDGEIVREAIPHIGYLHRCFEKHAENLSYEQIVPFTDRLDYIASMNQNWGFCLAVEEMLTTDPSKFESVPERAEYLRVLAGELNRIASHLLAFGTYGMDIGAFTPFLYAFRDREKILFLFEKLCGARLTYNYIRVGGVSRDLPPDFLDDVSDFLDYFEPKIDEYNALLTNNKIFIERTAGVAVMDEKMTINYGASGPNLRGAGRKWDLRKDEPYSIYDQFDFEIPIGEEIPSLGIVLGDCWNRYMVRMDEMKESVKDAQQKLFEIDEFC